MCGIAGIYSKDLSGRYEAEIRQMAEVLTHRGPDGEGFYRDDCVVMGFKRLSIIDLENGRQPLTNEDGMIVLVCNGEIFNYKELRAELLQKGHIFRTKCDVEVIIHLYEEYGVKLFDHLNGQFAFALYDIRRNTVMLARDHFGIAPLFYTRYEGSFAFASEIKSLLALPGIQRKVELSALDQLLLFPGIISPLTFFKGIHSLKPGHYVLIDGENATSVEYWDLDYPTESNYRNSLTEGDWKERLTEALVRSVRYRLTSDVPVAYYVSGGLDSSLVAAIGSSIKKEFDQSFSIVFSQMGIDERSFQKQFVQSHQFRHTEVEFHEHEIQSRIRKAVYHAESPLKESYNTCSMALSERVRSKNIKVVLSGEGSDELFGGYVGYKFDKQRKNSDNTEYTVEEEYDREIRRRLWGTPDLLYEKNLFAFTQLKSGLYSDAVRELHPSFDALQTEWVDKKKLAGRSPLHMRSYLDFKLRLSDHLVADHGDRVGYANSVELRYPFLDVNLVEVIKQIPDNLKLNGLNEKYILKQCAKKYLPESIINREKFSFVAPGSTAMLKSNNEWIKDTLSPATIKRQGYFDPETISRIRELYTEPGFGINQTFETDLLMIVLTFSLFMDEFGMPNLN